MYTVKIIQSFGLSCYYDRHESLVSNFTVFFMHSKIVSIGIMRFYIALYVTQDFPMYTLTSLPPGLLISIGGVVSARSVKLLDKIKDPEEPETRDAWWQEVRSEVRSHAQAMGCNAIAGYSESTSIW